MPSVTARVAVATAAALTCALMLAGATPSKSPSTLVPDTLVILSTSDVKGKTSPCG